MRFILLTAARETRSAWKRLVFFFVCIAIGVGAIVALRSVIQSVRRVLSSEARTLIASDILLSSDRPWAPGVEDRLARDVRDLPGAARTDSIEMATMARPGDEKALATKVVMPVGAVVAAADAGAAINTPAESGRCRRCGGQLVQRADDSDGVVLARLKVYHRQTEPLVLYYRNRPTFRSVDGAQPPDQVAAALAAAIDAAHRGATDADGGAR